MYFISDFVSRLISSCNRCTSFVVLEIMQSEKEDSWIGEVIGMGGVNEHNNVIRLQKSTIFKCLVPKYLKI